MLFRSVLLRRHGRRSGCVPRGRQEMAGRAEGRLESWGRPNETLGNERLFRAEGRTNMMAGVSLLPVARPPGTRGRVGEHNGGRRRSSSHPDASEGNGMCKQYRAGERGGKKSSRSPPDVQESIASEAKATFSTAFDREGPAPKFCHRALTR